jgi:hypothetical protein
VDVAVVYGGSLTLGQAIPLANQANAALAASVGLALPDLQARLDGALAISVAPPPSLADLIASVQAMLAALQTLLAAPLPDVSATLSLIADLQATMATLNANLALSLSFGNLLGSPGIHYYAYFGRADQLGPEMSGHLSAGLPGGAGPSENIAGVILAANDAGAIAALEAVFAAT